MPGKPSPPADLPAYVVDPIERQDPATLEAVRDYVDALLAYHARQADQALEEAELAEEGEEVVDVEEGSHGTIVTKKVSCGKASCSACPHGPYDYRVRRVGERVEWEYLGPSSRQG